MASINAIASQLAVLNTENTNETVIDVNNQILTSQTDVPIFNWLTVVMGDNFGFLTLDGTNRFLYDTVATISIMYDARSLIASDGSTTQLNWSTPDTLISSAQLLLSKTTNQIVFGTTNTTTLDFIAPSSPITFKWPSTVGTSGYSLITDGANPATLSWSHIVGLPAGTTAEMLQCLGTTWTAVSHIVDTSGAKSADWNNRYLYYSNGTVVTLNWEICLLTDNNNVNSVTWLDRYLYSSSNQILVAWDDQLLFDDSGSNLLSANWGLRILYDTGAHNSLDWTNRELIAGGGSTVQLNWATAGTLSSSAELALTKTTNQLVFGTTHTTTLNFPAPSSSITFNMPNNVGTSGYVLSTDGANPANLSWVAGGGGGVPSTTAGQILQNMSGTLTAVNYISDSSGVLSIDYENYNLNDPTGLSVDWSARNLQIVAGGGTTTLTWADQQCFDATAYKSIDWTNRYLYLSDGVTISVDWGSNALYDTAGVSTINWDAQWLGGAAGPTLYWSTSTLQQFTYETPALNWQLCQAYEYASTAGLLTIDWNVCRLYDNVTSALSADWTVRSLYDTTGTTNTVDYQGGFLNFYSVANVEVQPVLSWITNQYLYDASGLLSMDWTGRYLYWTDGNTIIIDWGDGFINDNGGNPCIGTNNRYLYWTDGATVAFDWSAGILYNPTIGAGYNVINLYDNQIIDNNQAESIDWFNRLLFDAISVLSVDWQDRYMYDSSGTNISVNWGNRDLQDSGNNLSLSWENRQLFDNTGFTVQLNWATAGTLSSSALLTLSSGLSLTKQANVTQTTSITTGVTSNGCSGQITTVSATTASASTSTFTVTNSSCLSTSYVQLQLVSYSGTYFTNGSPLLNVSATAAGSFDVTIANSGATALAGVLVFRYSIS